MKKVLLISVLIVSNCSWAGEYTEDAAAAIGGVVGSSGGPLGAAVGAIIGKYGVRATNAAVKDRLESYSDSMNQEFVDTHEHGFTIKAGGKTFKPSCSKPPCNSVR